MAARQGDRLTAPAPGELLAVAAEAAEGGAEVLLGYWRQGGLESETKSTGTDMVSAADLGSEQALRAVLARRRPTDVVLGEEGGLALADGTPLAANTGGGHGELHGLEAVRAARAAAGDGLVWICDPLDGTTNFLYGLRAWCVSVAVRDAAGVIAGAVCDPLSGERFEATRDGVCRIVAGDGTHTDLSAGSARLVERTTGLATALIGTGFAYNPAVRVQQGRVAAELVGEVRDIRRAGAAALDLCWVAAGRLDAYYERTVRPWDVAAGALICEQAGLEVRYLPAAGEVPDGVLAAPGELVQPLWDRVAEGAAPTGGAMIDLLT